MPYSVLFKELKLELNRLRRHFLPKHWNPTGTYSERIVDRARGYRVLAHAEIEYFLEKVLLDKVDLRHAEWETSKKTSYVIICLLAASKLGWQDVETVDLELPAIPPPKIQPNDDSINVMIKRAVEQYQGIIKENNGIKEKNIKRLLMPVGIPLSDLDPLWLNDMNVFGFSRGTFAHNSRRGISTLPDPKTEKETIDKLVIGLKLLDELIASL